MVVWSSSSSRAEPLLTTSEPCNDGVLEHSNAVHIFTVHSCGYLIQYFAIGFIFGSLPAAHYGFFICYLNVPAYVAKAVHTLYVFPWCLKVFFAIATDALPIVGLRRKPWMMIGWAVCTLFLTLLANTKLPKPYYCLGVDGKLDLRRVCNVDAALAAMPFSVLMMFASCGYVVADVAADGLTVSYARREPEATRGRTQTTAYISRTIGQVGAHLLIGLGMNGPEYAGTFNVGLSFNQLCVLLAFLSAAMLPITWLLVDEPLSTRLDKPLLAASRAHTACLVSCDRAEQLSHLRHFAQVAWSLFKSAALFEIFLFQV